MQSTLVTLDPDKTLPGKARADKGSFMQRIDKDSFKYVFLCGLHRSGTTVLGRNVGRLEQCTGFKNTPRSSDEEGQVLQDVYPVDTDFGGAGRFGFDPRAHVTENSDLLTPENIANLRASWHSYWADDKAICIEKTPRNLLMTRFMQAAFPNSYFIVIKRHPIAVSMATQRLKGPGIFWKLRPASLHRLFEHWLHCHRMFEQDKKYLNRVYELSYEDYIENPSKYHREIAAFIGTRVPEGLMEEITDAYNQKYIDRWRHLLTNSFFSGYYRYIARKYESRFTAHGYSLTNGLGLSEEVLRQTNEISDARGALYCVGADVAAFFRRFCTMNPKEQMKQWVPEFILGRIRRARRRTLLNKSTTRMMLT